MSNLKEIFEGLTEDQKKAVGSPPTGRLRIVAGAGSGKTEVLTRRIVSLLNNNIAPDELVAITYTQKAASEMKTRLIERRHLPATLLRDMKVSTFHAFISDLLKKDPFGAGIDCSDTVIAENDRQLILNELIEKFAQLHGDEIVSGKEKLGANVADKLIKEFPDALGKIRRYLLKPAEFYQLSRNRFTRRETSELERNCLEWLYRFYSYYIEELQNRNLLDFDEILIRGRELIKEQANSGEKSRSRVFLIDEFQDNNPEQLEIINLFCRNNNGHICVVGDEKQSIYRFQGADIETFRKFASNKDIILRENFRSYSEIIQFADLFLGNGNELKTLSPPQIAKRGKSPIKPAVCCFTAPENMTLEQICEELTEFIQKIVTSGLAIIDKRSGKKRPCRYGDIAIILNSVKALPHEFEDCLAAKQIPYLISGGLSFYARSEIEEILAFLKLLVQPDDDYSTVKILTGPLYGLKDSELAELAVARKNENTSLLSHLLAQPESALPGKVVEFRNLIVFLKNRSSKPGLIELCHCIIEQAGFFEYAAAQESELKRRRMENNLNKFLGIVRNFEQRGVFTSLRDFLEFIERIMLFGIDEEEAGLGLEEGDALKIMTIHKSKGLEFPVVICPFLKSRNYRASNKIYFDRELGLMVADPEQSGRKGFSEALQSYIEADEANSSSEDRRKLYVAFTRAENLLIVCGEEQRLAKQTEPLAEIHQLLTQNPNLGDIVSLDNWSSVLKKWLDCAGSMAPEITEIKVSKVDSTQIIDQLKHLANFLNQKIESPPKYKKEDIFSLADLAIYRQCPRKFFFTSRHINSFNDRPINLAATAGTVFHETVRIFHQQNGHNLLGMPEKERLADLIIDNLCRLYNDSGNFVYQSVKRMFRNYLESDLSTKRPWMIEAEINVRFETENGAFFLRGFVDRVDFDESEIKIIDFKTSRYNEETHVSFADQLALYMIAAKRGVLGKQSHLNFARSFIAYVNEPKMLLVELEPNLLAFEQSAVATVEKIRNEKLWQPGAKELCAKCGFAVLCHAAQLK